MKLVIIGAGVAGLVSGWTLAKEGHDVVMLERGEPGDGASSAAAGMLAPVAEATFGESSLVQLGLESLSMWQDFARGLERASGVEIDYQTRGTLVVAVDRDDLEALEHTHRLHRELGLEAELIDGDEARELEPFLAPSVSGAVHCPGDHQVDPRKLVAALVAAFEAAGGTLRTGVEVTGLSTKDGRVVGLETDTDEAFEADQYILAAGAWSRTIAGQGADRPHIRPVRGQMLSVVLGEPPLCQHVIRAPDAYLVPKSDGRLIIGATMEEMGWDDRLTAGGVMDLLVGAWEAMPAVYDRPILETWTGFRPMTLDNEPIIRRSDALVNLVFATGHGRNGILLTPVTGKRVLALIDRSGDFPPHE